jgi:hypothetical protein
LDKPAYISTLEARAAAEAAKAMNKIQRAEILEETLQGQQTQHSLQDPQDSMKKNSGSHTIISARST